MRRLSVLLSALLALAATFATPVFASSECPPSTQPVDSGAGRICIPVTDPGSGPGAPSDPGGGGGSETVGEMKCGYELAAPQPPSTDPIWDGHSPEDGRIFLKICPGYIGSLPLVFIPNGEDPEPIDPSVLARSVLDTLDLATAQVQLAPRPPKRTYVGLDTWMWIPSTQWTSIAKSVTAGSTTVSVTARPVRVDWDMGTGRTVCDGPGHAWREGVMGSGAESPCVYRYTRVSDFEPTGRFPVTAQITYTVTWMCTGNCTVSDGSLGEVQGLAGRSAVEVGERQSVVVNGGGR